MVDFRTSFEVPLALPRRGISFGGAMSGEEKILWDDEDVEFARNQLIALGKAIHSNTCVYVDFPSTLQAMALTELVTELTKAVSYYEEDRKGRAGTEGVN